MNPRVLRVHPADTVAVALADLPANEAVALGDLRLSTAGAIARGHKLALRAHAAGDPVLKYGAVIGRATRPIAIGEWVHQHNVATQLGDDAALSWTGPPRVLAAGAGTDARRAQSAAAPAPTWQGYERGSAAGTRNEIWIFPTVGCVARTAQRIAELSRARHAGRVDGIHAFVHPFGCSQLGDDLAGTRALLARLAAHPNAGGVLFIGLGCESNQMAALLDAVPPAARPRVRQIIAQDSADETEAGLAAIDELVEQAGSAHRTALPLSRLCLGLKCGGSDGFSGLTANPLLGRLSDRLAAAGGSMILTEIPEIFGAEALLLGRAESQAVFDAGLALCNDFRQYFRDHGEPVSENPSPGNIAGGISTLEEKSLGAVQKAGGVPLAAVARYGEAAAATGLTLLEAPGNDAVSSTALAAAGANLILFTTGRGTPLGFPVPTVKVASNSELAVRKPRWIDFDAGRALGGELEQLDADFLSRLMAIASGEPTAAEHNEQREIAIWKRGVTL
jgi:altronate hydrolase